jgi:hypothetical protein
VNNPHKIQKLFVNSIFTLDPQKDLENLVRNREQRILRPPPLPTPKSIYDTVHGIFLKLSTNVGPIKVNLLISFYLSEP